MCELSYFFIRLSDTPIDSAPALLGLDVQVSQVKLVWRWTLCGSSLNVREDVITIWFDDWKKVI